MNKFGNFGMFNGVEDYKFEIFEIGVWCYALESVLGEIKHHKSTE